MLVNFLFGAARSVKNADFGKYKYSRYDIGFNTHGSFSLSSDGGFGQNVIFGTGMSSSVHNDNNKKDILILTKGLTDRLNKTTLTSAKEYSMSFSDEKRNFCLSLHYIGSNSFLFGNCFEIYKFKAKERNKCTSIMSSKRFRRFFI